MPVPGRGVVGTAIDPDSNQSAGTSVTGPHGGLIGRDKAVEAVRERHGDRHALVSQPPLGSPDAGDGERRDETGCALVTLIGWQDLDAAPEQDDVDRGVVAAQRREPLPGNPLREADY
ncbi:hypothetical protein ACQEUX_12000 [Micromonospora sp. CA-259024]|uniref:hypothetical protein n=1 Tax=Micromonospora sp. CA-259024 TaxID=3239965 RepID=UPI003D924F13